jgi:ferredoxin--NADP+ reductase
MNSTVHPAGQPSVAIVGGGPAGCYTAQFLRKAWPDSEIVIFDRLPVPHGLVRYGVAPDHPGTKAIAKQFDRLFERDSVRFVGTTIISSDPDTGDFSVAQLRAAFDVVVLATGLHADRPLGDAGDVLPGSQLNGVYGAGRLTRLINGHPHENVTDVHIGRHSVIVGQGNVAIDLLRLFLTPEERLCELGIAPEVVASITAAPVSRIDIVGRSLCGEAKFDTAMIRELGKLEDVRFEADQLEIGELSGAAETARRDAVATLIAGSDPTATRLVHFWFGWAPVAILGDDSVRAVALRPVTGIVPSAVLRSALPSGATTSQTIELVADSVCTAIGFTEHPDAPFRRIDHEDPEHTDLDRGVLGDDLYCVGWLRRGPRGTIPENRADARMVADTIVAQHLTTSTTTTKAGFTALPYRSASTTAELHLSKETS